MTERLSSFFYYALIYPFTTVTYISPKGSMSYFLMTL